MEKLIWEKGFKAGRDLSKENMLKIAEEVGLDTKKLEADMSGECAQIVRKDQAEMQRVGTSGTPAFYINGRFLSGAQPIENFKRIIDQELEKAKSRIDKGEATAANYYDKFVVEKGKKTLE